MKIPSITFSFAPHVASFYALGFLSKHSGFGPASERRLQLIKKRFPFARNVVNEFLETTDEYRLFTQLKKALLLSQSPKQLSLKSPSWQQYLASYDKFIQTKTSKLLESKGKAFVKGLAEQWEHHKKIISQTAQKYKLVFPDKIECFVVQNIGEYGEAFDDTVVLSSDFRDITIAFAVFLEELVHLSITPAMQERIRNILPKVSQPLREEALVGFLMNQMLLRFGYDNPVRESIAYGWHGGKRERLVRKLENELQ